MAESKTTQFTPEQTQAILAAIQTGGGTGAISAPQGQENIVIKNDKFDASQPVSATNSPIITVPSPNAAAKPSTAQPTAYGSADTGWYVLDPSSPNGVKLIVPAHTPNADDEVNKALDRQKNEALRNERQANSDAGNGYITAAELQKLQLDARAQGLSEAQLKQKIYEFDQSQGQQQRQFDKTQAEKEKVDAANIGLTTAQTAGQQATTQRTGAETQQIQQNIDVTKAKLPGDLAQQAATLAGTEASTAGQQATTQRTQQQIAQGNAPTVQTTPTGMSIWQRDPNSGAVSAAGINPEFIPKTQAEVAARVGQIQSLMQAKGAEVQGKVGQTIAGKQYTADDALREYNSWYDAQVAPQQQSLQAAQQAAQFQQAKDQTEMQRASYQTALGAGTQAISAFAGMQNGRVGPGFEAASAAASKGDFAGLGAVPNAVTYQAPDLTKTANDAVMDALKYISPTAAAATGTPPPNFQAIDVPGQLNRTRYMPSGMPTPPVPAAPAAAPAQGLPPVAPIPPAVPPGMINPAYQKMYPGGGAGTPATGPIVGATTGTGTPWDWMQYQFGG